MKKSTKAAENEKPEINYRGIKAMPFIIGNETFEKLGAIGTLSNLLVYLTTDFHMKAVAATNLITVFQGTANFSTLLGAFLADTYFGRYKILGFASVASFMGLVLIDLTAVIKSLHPSPCEAKDLECNGPSPWQMTFLLTGLGLMIIGAGGIRPCNLAFGADQFNPNTESGKRGINSFFNWFLDKGAVITPDDEVRPDGSASNPWKLCTKQQVEEVKVIMRVIPIWVSAIIYHVPIVLMHTYVVFQALQSNRHLGKTKFQIPASSYIVFLMIVFTLWIPIYDRILVPLLERVFGKEGGITILQRMGIGIGFSVLTMLVSGMVEEHRRNLAHTKPTIGIYPRKGEISSMSGLWLVAPSSLAGLAEAFMAVGQVEFYYKQFPENMRSLSGSLFFCGMAMSSYLSSFLVSIVHYTTKKGKLGDWLSEDLNKGRLDYFYYVVAALGTLNLVYFLACAKWYKYKGSSENEQKLDTYPAGFVELTQSEKVIV